MEAASGEERRQIGGAAATIFDASDGLPRHHAGAAGSAFERVVDVAGHRQI